MSLAFNKALEIVDSFDGISISVTAWKQQIDLATESCKEKVTDPVWVRFHGMPEPVAHGARVRMGIRMPLRLAAGQTTCSRAF